MAFRTKKISQMDPKGSNLASTDLLEISQLVSGSYVTKSITGAEIVASVPPSVTAWGTITGTLSSQTDLNTALSGKVPTTRTLTINGTTQDLSADRTFTISTGITIGTTAITSGTVGRVLFEGTGNVVQESANLFWDNTNGRLGIGGTPTAPLHVVFNPATSAGINIDGTANSVNHIAFMRNGAVYGRLGVNASSGEFRWDCGFASGGYFPTIYTGGLERMRIGAVTGNVLINTTTDAGFKLDVNGTARVSSFIDCRSYGSFRGDFYVYQGGGGGGFSITQTAGQTYLIGQSSHDMIMGKVGGYSFILKNQTRIFGMDDTTGTALTNASALLTMTSTTKGFLPPRMTTTEKNAIASPATGLMVYDTTLNLIALYNGTIWTTL